MCGSDGVMWFEDLVGFAEETSEQVRANLWVDGALLHSRVNGATYVCGTLETPTLGELRRRVADTHPCGAAAASGAAAPSGAATSEAGQGITVREVVGDVQDLHADTAHAGALFQVASQFNVLEMVSPDVTPERGVGIYEDDRTQGPACAVAAGAGTIYRNYFAPVGGTIGQAGEARQTGQSASRQIDCLADLGAALGNTQGQLWQMRNGYALPSREGLREVSRHLHSATAEERDALRQLLRIGIQWNTQVTIRGCTHTVSQAYCSALPVAYGGHPPAIWEDFAVLVLEAAYEATMCAAILNAAGGGSRKLFLTLLGGGVFGNDMEWITGALERAIRIAGAGASVGASAAAPPLDVAIVSYGSSRREVQRLLTS